jgi:hypothetical protein
MAVSEGFIQEDARRLVISAPTAKELVLKLEVNKAYELNLSITFALLFTFTHWKSVQTQIDRLI